MSKRLMATVLACVLLAGSMGTAQAGGGVGRRPTPPIPGQRRAPQYKPDWGGVIHGGAITPLLGAMTPGQAHPQPQHGSRPTRVHLIRVHALAVPRRDYTIEVPVGWGFRADTSADYTEDPIIVRPVGRDEPAAFIYGMLPINGFKAMASQSPMSEMATDPNGFVQAFVQAEAAAMSTRWSAADAAAIIVKLLATGVPDARLLFVTPQSATRATVQVRYTVNGKQLDGRWVITTAYVLNPAWTAVIGTPAWDSFAFIAGCEAKTGSLDAAQPVCARILASFHPNGAWLSGLINQYLANLAQQMQMVGRTVATIGQMQYQEQLQMMDTTYRVGYRWWQTLGNDIDLRNPETGTIWWSTDAGYRYYCETPQQAIIGSDNYLALSEAPDCRTMLQQVDPLRP